jgi:hypothetical protein
MNISVYSIEAWICVYLIVRWMSSVLVEQGLLLRFARTFLPIVAYFTRSFARLLIGTFDSAKRLLAPSEAVDEIAIEDSDMEEITIKYDEVSSVLHIFGWEMLAFTNCG